MLYILFIIKMFCGWCWGTAADDDYKIIQTDFRPLIIKYLLKIQQHSIALIKLQLQMLHSTATL